MYKILAVDMMGFELFLPDGEGYYHIGSHSWCWNDVAVAGDPRKDYVVCE